MYHTSSNIFSFVFLFLSAVHLSSSQQGQEFFFGNAAQRGQFLQQQPSSAQPQQFSNFFQPINSGPFSPFRSSDISSSSQPQFQQSFQQSFPLQPTAFQLPSQQISVPSSQTFNSFVPSARASPQAQAFQPGKAQNDFQSTFRQQKQQPFSNSPSVSRGEPRFPFTGFSSVESSRPNFQANIPASTFRPQAFSAVFQDDESKEFNGFAPKQVEKENIDDFVPQSRWRSTKTNTDVDNNRLQRKPTPVQKVQAPSRTPDFSPEDETDSNENDSNSLGNQNIDYYEPATFFKQPQNTKPAAAFQRTRPLLDSKPQNFSPKTRFEVSTYRPQFPFPSRSTEPPRFVSRTPNKPQFVAKEAQEEVDEELEGDEDLEDGEESEEEYIDEPPSRPAQQPRTTEAVRPDARVHPTTFSPPFSSKARYINNQSNRQSQSNAQPEVTTFRQKPAKNFASNTIDNNRSNGSIFPITLKNKFRTGPVKSNSTFDVMMMNKHQPLVTDDNFKAFIDSASIDVTEVPHIAAGEPNVSDEESGGLQVAVQPSSTTKKIPVKSTTVSPEKFSMVTDTSMASKGTTPTNTPIQKTPTSVLPPNKEDSPTSTESWVIVASVQTSRSVSGARFIPSSAIKQEEQPKPLIPKGKEEDEERAGHNRNSSSTESIIDKLDRVQSELSSGILTGGFKMTESDKHDKFDLDLPETKSEVKNSTTTETITTTTHTDPEEPSSTVGSKFVPSSKRFTTTSKPTSKPSGKTSLKDSIQFNEELVGLLPPGFKPRTFTKKSSTTTSTTAASTTSEITTSKPSGTTRSLIPKLKSKVKFEDVNSFLPPGYTPPADDVTASSTTKPALDSILSKVKFDDVSALLPPGYKPAPSNSEKTSKSTPKIKFEEPAISSLLPKGFKPSSAEGEKDITSVITKAKPVDISAFLPPGFNPNEKPVEESIQKNKVNSLNEDPSDSTNSTNEAITTSSASPKVVFPSRPGGGVRKNATSSAKSPSKGGTFTLKPTIQKGWPTRATTEFTGWPSPPTSTISIEELLAAAKAAATSTETSAAADGVSTSTTTTTTTTTPAPTTPGYCVTNCELAATIKLVGGAKWVPELLDHNTKEWQTLANEVEEQLDAVYRDSSALHKWYKKIRIDAFSPGSVLVDYFVELSELGRTVSTADMKRLFHESLLQNTVNSEALTSNHPSSAEYSKLKLGSFDVDPKFTDFVVLQKTQLPSIEMGEKADGFPQWAIAVIVIGLASLLFVLIFGITVLVSRHKNAKKHPSVLTEDMLHELNKNHMGGGGHDNYGADDLYNMEDVWNDKPIKKRNSTAYQENSMPNLYDSWRSDWNGYYYNAYYGGAGTNHSSGYASRRRSDYDTNF